MKEISTQQLNNLHANLFNSHFEKQIDFRDFFYTLYAEKKFILIITAVAFLIGFCIAMLVSNKYQADTLIQVSESSSTSSISSQMGNAIMGGASQTGSLADVQSALIKSRFILVPALEALEEIEIKPHYFPILGKWMAKNEIKKLRKPLFGLRKYVWGGEQVTVDHLLLPAELQNRPLKLVAAENNIYHLFLPNGKLLLRAKVDQFASIRINDHFNIEILVKKMTANSGAEFFIYKSTIGKLANKVAKTLSISDLGKFDKLGKTGILQITYTDTNPQRVANILNSIVNILLKKDIERKSAEAAKMLDFLNKQLPLIKQSLNAAETKLNKYKAKSGSIDLSFETQALLTLSSDIQKQIAQTSIDKATMLQQYTSIHPIIIGLDKKKMILEQEAQQIENKLRKLPLANQTAVNLMRDVEVKSALYLLILNRVNELQITKEGTISDIRVLSVANVPTVPLSGDKLFIGLVSALVGLILASLIIFVRKYFNNKINDPNWMDTNFSIPTFAIVPHSKYQSHEIVTNHEKQISYQLLAKRESNDLSIEALRSLRTGLQFALMGAKNNIISIMGISPGIGKSFIATNFSYVLAQTGKKVLLIDGDLRKGLLHESFTNKKSPGLSNVIVDNSILQEVIQTTSFSHLDFIAKGEGNSDSSELLMSEQFKDLLNILSSKYDYIVIDTPPILAVSDSLIIANYSGINLLILGAGKHQPEEIQVAMKKFQTNGVTINGAIFNFVDAKSMHTMIGRFNYHYEYGEAS